MTRGHRSQRGAALLIAMLVLTLVATLASGMVWQQWRAAEVEAAERDREQAGWILLGAQDWARLILREDARSGKPTSLTEPWATPLAEARLSTFLAVDQAQTDDAPDAFLSGRIVDAQSRYNLRNLIVEGKVSPDELAILGRLCQTAGLEPDLADTIASQWQAAEAGGEQAPLPPAQFDDLAWFGLPPLALERLRPLLVVLPAPTAVNVNTAPPEVLASVIPNLDLGGADRLVQQRQRQPFANLEEVRKALGLDKPLPPRDLAVLSSFFEVQGRLRVDNRVVESTALVERRNGLEVVTLARSVRPAAP
jgi:general secretion pathway protein K